MIHPLHSMNTAALQSRLNGQLILPGDADYDQARAVWNGMIDKQPALIARCANAADVITAVNFARENNLLVSVRGGGHNVAGNAVNDGGLVIDLSQMRSVYVNPEAHTVRAGGGTTLGEIDSATQAYGLATPLGVVSETGVAGLTLGGGLGWLRRKYGLTSDNLLSADVVTADGRLVTASASENPDLFWGLRGGGGNFGVVTSFELRLHPVGPEVALAYVVYPFALATQALQFFRDYAATAPDEVSAFAIFGTIPEAPSFPGDAHGRPYVMFLAVHCGDVNEGQRVLQPLRRFAQPIVDFSGVKPYVEVQKILDEDYPSGTMRYYWKSAYITSLDDTVIARLVEQNMRRPSPHSTVDIWQLGGAMSRVGASETAFGTRSAPFLIGVESNWHDPQQDDVNIAWVREYIRQLQPFSDGTQYLNFPGMYEEGETMMRTTFGSNYQRLAALKRKWDPTNLFRLNQNIKPE